ncbi:hypothetical protein JMF97_04085 [Micromonospora fiedleri]|uniref:Uncharacterized protein n=1 Tax=Micromonospora fiedleri TaxID=1157498 RepID=A0ABS1UGJ6_9ACTN|nr:hypothetical protein [Micromonospora fiedleri]MBL6275339.1 hypothetical protein [Micromonospora fiedleri]
MDEELLRGSCPACEVGIGETHADDCDVAECLATGRKRMWCWAQADTAGHDCGQADWTGRWPGHRECREFGWHVQWDREAQTWSRCSSDVPGSGPELTRLYAQARWNADQRQWERRRAVVFIGVLRGGRAAAEELAKVAQRWAVHEGLDVVCEHVGAHAWRSVVADVADGRVELVVVPSVAALGHGRQLFARIAAVRDAGGNVAGPGVVVDEDGRVVEKTLPGEARRIHDGGR